MSTSFRSERISRHQSRRTSFSIILQLVLIFIFVSAAFLFFFVKWTWGLEITPKSYTIDKGSSMLSLNSKLKWDISDWRYSLWVKYFAPENVNLKVGKYEATRGTTVETFFTKTLTTPIHSDIEIMILPWWNMYDIDKYLVEKDIIKTWEFLRVASDRFLEYQKRFNFLEWVDSLEWFLFPDTYRITKDATANEVILKLLWGFENKIGESYNKLGKNAYKKLILASIVEREERIDVNQPIVAGILEKRVLEGMPMWADATVCVWYGKTQKECTPAFVATVIGERNPYNTRSSQWYPPTPIANVPLAAWNAAIKPEVSPYYYYLHDNDGNIRYWRTNEEHVANKRKYLN